MRVDRNEGEWRRPSCLISLTGIRRQGKTGRGPNRAKRLSGRHGAQRWREGRRLTLSVRDGSPKGRDAAGGSMRSTRARPERSEGTPLPYPLFGNLMFLGHAAA